jgi:hypothetical protein
MLRWCTIRTVARGSGRFRSILPLGVWDARSGRSGDGRTLSYQRAAGLEGA